MCNHNNPGEGRGCGFCLSKHSHQALRIAFWVLIVVGFAVAVGAGIESARFAVMRKTAMAYSKAGYNVQPTYTGYRVLPKVQIVRPDALPQPVMVYGKVLKVEGNMITILNNAAQEQVVVSTAETSITIGDKEYGISNVEKDDEGMFGGFMNKQNQLEAKVIELK